MNWSDFGERNKRLNPLWTLGAGMNLGELQPYKEMIALSVLLQVYYLELESNERRAKEDIIELAWSSLERFNIARFGTIESVERLVDGLLWSGGGGDFEAFYYDDQTRQMTLQKYKYFTVDEDATRTSWEESGKTVYRLSEYAMELIFMSHEIIEEFQISIKLLEIQMHIKHGRVTRAMQDVGELISRVRKMTQQQQEYRNALRRNPKHMFSEYGVMRHQRLEEIHQQFDEERKHFDNIHRSLARLANDEKDVIDFNELRLLSERVELSRKVHDELAEVVLSIFEAETNLRLNFPELFWGAAGFNFRTNVWEEWVKAEGLPSGDSLETLISGLFTPSQDFIYPSPGLGKNRMSVFCRKNIWMSPMKKGRSNLQLIRLSLYLGLKLLSCGNRFLPSLPAKDVLRSKRMHSLLRNSPDGRGSRMPLTFGYNSFIPRLSYRSETKTTLAEVTSARS